MTFCENKPASSTFVSVIIPVFNDTDRLKSCFEALRRQTHQDFEILVIDNGSTAPGLDVLCAQFENVKLLNEPEPGSYAARNKGLNFAKGNIIAFTDADCIPNETWLQLGVEWLRSQPNCGLVAGRIEVFPHDPTAPTKAELYEMRWAFNQRHFVENEKFGATANMFTTRSVFDQVGIFNGGLKSSGDREWGNRVADNGYTLIYAPNVHILHPARSTMHEIRRKLRRITGGRHDVSKSRRASFILLLKYLNPPSKQLRQTFNDSTDLTLGQKFQVCTVIMALRITVIAEIIMLWWGDAPSARA